MRHFSTQIKPNLRVENLKKYRTVVFLHAAKGGASEPAGLILASIRPLFKLVACRLPVLAEERARLQQMQVLPRKVQILLCSMNSRGQPRRTLVVPKTM